MFTHIYIYIHIYIAITTSVIYFWYLYIHTSIYIYLIVTTFLFVWGHSLFTYFCAAVDKNWNRCPFLQARGSRLPWLSGRLFKTEVKISPQYHGARARHIVTCPEPESLNASCPKNIRINDHLPRVRTNSRFHSSLSLYIYSYCYNYIYLYTYTYIYIYYWFLEYIFISI